MRVSGQTFLAPSVQSLCVCPCTNWAGDLLTWALSSPSVISGFSDKFKSSFNTWTCRREGWVYWISKYNPLPRVLSSSSSTPHKLPSAPPSLDATLSVKSPLGSSDPWHLFESSYLTSVLVAGEAGRAQQMSPNTVSLVCVQSPPFFPNLCLCAHIYTCVCMRRSEAEVSGVCDRTSPQTLRLGPHLNPELLEVIFLKCEKYFMII